MENQTKYTGKEIKFLVAESTSEQLLSLANQLSPENLMAAIPLLDNSKDGQEKLHAIISGLSEHLLLEAVGKSLSPAQMLALLSLDSESTKIDIDRLSNLLVGMTRETFTQLLSQSSELQIRSLQDIAQTEPLQHHLTILANTLTANCSDLSSEFGKIEEIIMNLDVGELNSLDVVNLLRRIELLRIAFNVLLEITDKAISISWHTDRSDFIEKFNTIRSNAYHSINSVGKSGDLKTELPSGIFFQLFQRVMAIYGNADDPHDVEALHNDDLAVEALPKFSIWYIDDLYKIGLLSEIQSVEQLEMDLDKHSEHERTQLHVELFQKAKVALDDLGLHTVFDLKNNLIFSRKTLLDYIQRAINMRPSQVSG